MLLDRSDDSAEKVRQLTDHRWWGHTSVDDGTLVLSEKFTGRHFLGARAASQRLVLFQVEAGYLGLALERIQEGGMVVLFSGVPVLLIFRSGGKDYQLISTAIIHGVMEGQL